MVVAYVEAATINKGHGAEEDGVRGGCDNSGEGGVLSAYNEREINEMFEDVTTSNNFCSNYGALGKELAQRHAI
ncbi:hypothetical protein Tco_0819916 [Tanacetum coccineum]|uniref:Uncharacterized protein n=1 Tax=Tanacetum coccineum TaxID=301880 RepID=A0ABQ5AAU2_9ASTR